MLSRSSILRTQVILLLLGIPAVASFESSSSSSSSCHGASLNCLQDVGDDRTQCEHVQGCIWTTSGNLAVKAYCNTTGTKHVGHCESDIDEGLANAAPCHEFDTSPEQCLPQGCDWSGGPGAGGSSGSGGEDNQDSMAVGCPGNATPADGTTASAATTGGYAKATTTPGKGIRWQMDGGGLLIGFFLGAAMIFILCLMGSVACICNHTQKRKQE